MFQLLHVTLLLTWWTCSTPMATTASLDPWSCAARCGVFLPEAGCQCNEACVYFGDCCPDLCGVCTPSVPMACDCVPRCQDRRCGPDGCGGTCGECPGSSRCLEGLCLAGDLVCAGPRGRSFLQPQEANRLERWAPQDLPPALVALVAGHLGGGGRNPCDSVCPTTLRPLEAEAWISPAGEVLLARLHLHQPNLSGGGWRAEVISRPPWTDVLGYGFSPGPEVAHRQRPPETSAGVLAGLHEEAMRLAPASAVVIDLTFAVVWIGCRITGYDVIYTLALYDDGPSPLRIRFHLDARQRLVSVETR